MKEDTGNIFHFDCDAVCITTNGFVKRNGECVMGKGCAQQAKNMLPSLPHTLGQLIRGTGNIVHKLHFQNDTWLLSFPVKGVSMQIEHLDQLDKVVRHKANDFGIGSTVPGWALKADLKIIQDSALRLSAMADFHNWTNVVLPRPGCGAGELDWEQDVKPLLSGLLDDRFTAVTYS